MYWLNLRQKTFQINSFRSRYWLRCCPPRVAQLTTTRHAVHQALHQPGHQQISPKICPFLTNITQSPRKISQVTLSSNTGITVNTEEDWIELVGDNLRRTFLKKKRKVQLDNPRLWWGKVDTSQLPQSYRCNSILYNYELVKKMSEYLIIDCTLLNM